MSPESIITFCPTWFLGVLTHIKLTGRSKAFRTGQHPNTTPAFFSEANKKLTEELQHRGQPTQNSDISSGSSCPYARQTDRWTGGLTWWDTWSWFMRCRTSLQLSDAPLEIGRSRDAAA